MGGDSKKYYDYEELAKAYLELGTIKAVAKKYSCDIATVRVACKENNIEIIPGNTINKKKIFKASCYVRCFFW